MGREEVRTGGAVLLFNAFALVALFFLLAPFFPGRTGTVVINEIKIYYNSGWLSAYFIALAATLCADHYLWGAEKGCFDNPRGVGRFLVAGGCLQPVAACQFAGQLRQTGFEGAPGLPAPSGGGSWDPGLLGALELLQLDLPVDFFRAGKK